MKSSFNRTKLVTAMAVVLGASGAATPTLAVNLSDNGLGEVGMVPYYTVRNNIDTNISVVNTSAKYVVAFKIRFREGDNSRDARDFNVFLSPSDVWTATVTLKADDDDDPTNDVPVLRTADQSCTAPILEQVGETADGRAVRQIDFTNIAYAGGSELAPDTDEADLLTIERAQEGHIEVIAMGVADPDVSELASWAVHGPGMDCGNIVGVYTGVREIASSGVCGEGAAGDPVTGNDAFEEEYCEPLNVLKVAANLITVDQGVAGGMPVEMLANFFNPAADGVEDPLAPAPQDLMSDPATQDPNLSDANPAISIQITEQGPVEAAFLAGENPGADAVSSLFSSTEVINEYAVGGAGLAQTAWVVNFPTKNFYVDAELSTDPAPFSQFFQFNGVSCVLVDYLYFNREESFVDEPPGGLEPSPPPVVDIPLDSICQETQVLNFGDEALLGSKNNYFVNPEFDNGWMRLGFPLAGSIFGFDPATAAIIEFKGLPVMGFSIKSLENGVAGTNTLNYGIISEHAYHRAIDIDVDGTEPEPGL